MRFIRGILVLAGTVLLVSTIWAQQKSSELIREPLKDVAPVAMPKINNAALEKLGWRLGAQAYTFRAVSLFETIDQLNALGLHYVEMYPGQRFSKEKNVRADHSMSPELIAELLKKLKDSNVTALSYGVVGLSKNEAESRKVFDFAKKMGLETIVSEPPLDSFDTLDKLAQEYGINVAIHEHSKAARSIYWDPQTVLDVSKGRSKRIGACADIGHWARSGFVALDCLKKLEGRIIELHVKDLNVREDAGHDVVWGTGINDIKGVMTELKRQGIKPFFAIEYETGQGTELVRNVAKSVEYFSLVATDLAGAATASR